MNEVPTIQSLSGRWFNTQLVDWNQVHWWTMKRCFVNWPRHSHPLPMCKKGQHTSDHTSCKWMRCNLYFKAKSNLLHQYGEVQVHHSSSIYFSKCDVSSLQEGGGEGGELKSPIIAVIPVTHASNCVINAISDITVGDSFNVICPFLFLISTKKSDSNFIWWSNLPCLFSTPALICSLFIVLHHSLLHLAHPF